MQPVGQPLQPSGVPVIWFCLGLVTPPTVVLVIALWIRAKVRAARSLDSGRRV